MAYTIQWSTNIKISGGPQISCSRSISVEAYDSIQIIALGTSTSDPAGAANDMQVEIQPSSTSGQVTFLAITSDHYDANLSYTVNSDSSSGAASIALDEPHILVGPGAIGLLDPAPERLFITSKIAQDTQIQIIIGRDATP